MSKCLEELKRRVLYPGEPRPRRIVCVLAKNLVSDNHSMRELVAPTPNPDPNRDELPTFGGEADQIGFS